MHGEGILKSTYNSASKLVCDHHSAACQIIYNVSVVTPWLAAAEVDVPLTECALNTLVSIPESPITCFNHLATVDDVTGWWGFMIAINS